MARITFDDDMDHDPRVMALKAMLGDVEAWGSMVGAYRVASKYYVPDRKPVPTKIFKLLPWAPPLIESGVAELTEDGQGIFIIQSEEQFGWLVSKHENGKKGGRPKDEPPNQTGPKPNLTETKPNETELNLGSESVTHDNPLAPAPAFASAPALKREREKFLSREEIDECIQEWGKTLTHHSIDKPPNLDEVEIVRLIQKWGFEKTKLALAGAAFEESSKDYNPTKYVYISRLTKPDIFEKFVNLGAQNRPKERQFHEDEVVVC